MPVAADDQNWNGLRVATRQTGTAPKRSDSTIVLLPVRRRRAGA